jgi:coenzyme F420 biosynthesis associated uncharacterized protein
MIDWNTAQRVGDLVSGTPPPGRLPDDIVARAEDFARRVSAYTRLAAREQLPPPEGVDRGAWIGANLHSMRPLLDPLAERVGGGLGPLAGPLQAVTGRLLGAQVGLLVGLLSQRVLGQYDLVLLDAHAPTRLLLVAPNLADAAANLGVDHDQLVSWVTVHEVTHAVQFSGVPWLRQHLGGLLGELLAGLEVTIAPASMLRLPDGKDLRELVEAARRGDLLRVIIGPERQDLVDRLQATMSLIEGHAEHVMDAVGAEVLPSLPRLREALDRRRATRSTSWRLIERVLGLELKMRQYEAGRRFCDTVVQAGGIAALNRAWAAPEALPTPAELEKPHLWLTRTNVPAVTKSAS